MSIKMTIKQKLSLGYGAMVFLSLVAGGCAYWSLNTVAEMSLKLTRIDAVKMYNAGKIAASTGEMLAEERAIMLSARMHDSLSVQRSERSFEVSATQVRHSVDIMQPLLTTPEGTLLVNNLVKGLEEVENGYKDFSQAIQHDDLDQASVLLSASTSKMQMLSGLGDQALDRQQARMAMFSEGVSDEVSRGRIIQLCVSLLVVFCSVVLWFIVHYLDDSLRVSIESLADGADEVESAASQVSSSSQILARDASEQAAQIEETSASAEEINAMASRNLEHSETTAGLVAKLQQDLNSTNEALAASVAAMNEIGESSTKISKIIEVIDKIAFQTNILALNAAVEAARAGEAGMGFSVVAEEVRNLAKRSSEAARDTADLIERSILLSTAGKVKVNLVAESGGRVVEQFSKIKMLVDEIHLGSQEQGRGVNQITRAITQMEQGTQKSAAHAEQSAAAAQELTAQSSTLRQIASELSGMVGIAHRTNPSAGQVRRHFNAASELGVSDRGGTVRTASSFFTSPRKGEGSLENSGRGSLSSNNSFESF